MNSFLFNFGDRVAEHQQPNISLIQQIRRIHHQRQRRLASLHLELRPPRIPGQPKGQAPILRALPVQPRLHRAPLVRNGPAVVRRRPSQRGPERGGGGHLQLQAVHQRRALTVPPAMQSVQQLLVQLQRQHSQRVRAHQRKRRGVQVRAVHQFLYQKRLRSRHRRRRSHFETERRQRRISRAL